MVGRVGVTAAFVGDGDLHFDAGAANATVAKVATDIMLGEKCMVDECDEIDGDIEFTTGQQRCL